MTREDLKEKEYREIEGMLNSELVMFSDEISKLTMEELHAKEEEILREMAEYDKYLDTVAYELPQSVEFEDEKYTRSAIGKYIVKFLSKMEVEFSYTLGMYQLIKLWQSTTKSVNYKAYDSTLRCLNSCKFKGADEWKQILGINTYLTDCHEMYKKDLSWLIFLSTKHNALMDKIKEMGETKPEPILENAE